MRTFGNDSPEFMAFKIEGNEKVYKIPLAGSMTNKEIIQFEETDGDYKKQLEWLRQYIGNAVDDLTAATTGEILHAWAAESKEQGATPGE